MLKSKTFKTATISTVALTMAMVSISAVNANSSRSNAAQVKDVTLSQPGINFHVHLENKSSNKHISKVNIKPLSDKIALPLKGFVQCAKDKDTDFVNAKVYFGRVKRTGSQVVPTDTLHSANYYPTNSEWTGVLHGWVTEVGNPLPYTVSLSALKNGSADLKFDPVAVFNDKLQDHIDGGGSKLEFLRNDQLVTVNRPISLVGTCREAISFSQSENGSGYVTASIPITIKYKGDPALKGGINQDNMAKDLAAPFKVTSAKVTPHVKDYVGQCPTNLKFRLSVKAEGTGKVKFRLISKNGAKGPVHNINFTKNDLGSKVFDFTKAIKEAQKGGISNIKAANQQPKGNINQLAANPTSKKFGSWKVEIVEPQAMTSAESFYSWKCQTPKGPTTFKAPAPAPKPGLKIKAPEPKPTQLKLKTN